MTIIDATQCARHCKYICNPVVYLVGRRPNVEHICDWLPSLKSLARAPTIRQRLTLSLYSIASRTLGLQSYTFVNDTRLGRTIPRLSLDPACIRHASIASVLLRTRNDVVMLGVCQSPRVRCVSSSETESMHHIGRQRRS